MIDMYIRLITNTTDWTLTRVPTKYRTDVEEKLTEQGYDENGNKVA